MLVDNLQAAPGAVDCLAGSMVLPPESPEDYPPTTPDRFNEAPSHASGLFFDRISPKPDPNPSKASFSLCVIVGANDPFFASSSPTLVHPRLAPCQHPGR